MTPRWITKETPERIVYAPDADGAAKKLGVTVDDVHLAGVYDPVSNGIIGEDGLPNMVAAFVLEAVALTTSKPKTNGLHAPNGVPYLNGGAKCPTT